MLRKMATLGGSALAAMVLLPAPAFANAGPALPWPEPLPFQLSLVGLLFVLSAGVSLSGWRLLKRVERAARQEREEGA
jgi:hypothetical protein